MATQDFDTLRENWKAAVQTAIDAIRAEEALATPEHSMVADEAWDAAGFQVQDALKAAHQARDAYKNALREKNYGF